MIFSVFLALYS